MNTPARFEYNSTAIAPTPVDLTITVRDERFNRGGNPARWWAGEPSPSTPGTTPPAAGAHGDAGKCAA